MVSDTIQSHISFIDRLFAIVFGFMLINFKEFGIIDLLYHNDIRLQLIIPFFFLYILFMIKLSFFWYESRNNLKILSTFYDIKIGRENYLSIVVSAFLFSQLITSVINDADKIQGNMNSIFFNFLVWLIIAIILGDAIPTLFVIIPRVQSYLIHKRRISIDSKMGNDHKHYFINIVKINALINIINNLFIVVVYVYLSHLVKDGLFIIYCIVILIVIINLAQELFLKRARDKFLKDSFSVINR